MELRVRAISSCTNIGITIFMQKNRFSKHMDDPDIKNAIVYVIGNSFFPFAVDSLI